MAEDPNTWGEAELIVNEVLMRTRDPEMCGLSDVRLITDALREAGLLKSPELRDLHRQYAHAVKAFRTQDPDLDEWTDQPIGPAPYLRKVLPAMQYDSHEKAYVPTDSERSDPDT